MGSQLPSPVHLFINYANADGEFALHLYEDLLSSGYSTWIDQRDIGYDDWHQAVNRALHAATHMLLIWTRNTETEREVESEWGAFLALGKPILVLLQDRHPIDYDLQRFPTIDFTGDYDSAFKRLQAHL